ncbi:MAG TPA: NAD(P)/FAD-dependent oxidoreductase, partial [Candidatus Diapherotrites archaeon]|nr:NAD(P)/FAD-dependent oxidoreductase [Candidatus Diapherotrites archaeon]
AVSLDVKGVRVIFRDGTASLVEEKGYVLEKHKFEQWISAEAQKAGAEVKLGHRVTDLQRVGPLTGAGKLWRVACGEKSFSAKVVVDATGPQALSSSKLGLNKRFDLVIGIQYEMMDIPQEGWLDFYLWPKLAPEGYLWMIPKCAGRANVGLVTTEKNKAKAYLDEFVKQMGWEKKVVKKTFGGPIPASGPVEKTFADGLLLVGDAAGFTSPLFEGGTHLGIVSGKLAAETAAKAIHGGDWNAKALSEYERKWKAEFPPYPKIVEGKEAMYAFTDPELNQMAHLLPKDLLGMTAWQKLGIALKLLVGNHNLVRKGVLRVFHAFKYSSAKYYGW